MHQTSATLWPTAAAAVALALAAPLPASAQTNSVPTNTQPPEPAPTQTHTVPLTPANTQLTFTSYALGLFPLPGHFKQFTGNIAVDPANPDNCKVNLDVDVPSLSMADPARARQALAPNMMDAEHFPHLTYAGSCANGRATGMLTMHGVTREISLASTLDGDKVTATGSLHRHDFGVDGMTGLVGGTTKISFAVTLPNNLAGLAHTAPNLVHTTQSTAPATQTSPADAPQPPHKGG